MKLKNGYGDSSGKGTITFNNKGILRVHWGCSCCDYWDEGDMDTKEMKLAEIIVKLLNKNRQALKEIKKLYFKPKSKTVKK